MFAFLATGDWREVLDESGLPVSDRVAIAIRFLSDSEVRPTFSQLPPSLTLRLLASSYHSFTLWPPNLSPQATSLPSYFSVSNPPPFPSSNPTSTVQAISKQ